MDGPSLAVVTGASSGIGEAIARQLADEGHDLLLVARGAARLESTAETLRATAGGTIEVMPADLASDEGVEKIALSIAERRPEIVVNCAGSGWRGAFSEQPVEELESLIRLDVLSLALLSRAALSVMMERGSGALLNVSSTASFVPGPSVAAYHASKAFVTSLTEALHVEATGTSVHVTALCPGITPTGFQARAGTEHDHLPGFLSTTPERVASEGLAALRRNDAICIPGVANKTIGVLARVAPRWLVRKVARSFIAKV